MAITSFSGQYRFLSNFFPARVMFDGIEYATTEHAFQAAKTLDLARRELIRLAPTPGAAKALGGDREKTVMRADWEDIKIAVMANLLEQKFADPILKAKLMATAPQDLHEGNTWGDTFWGECPIGNGKNWLGILLMSLRDDPLGLYFG